MENALEQIGYGLAGLAGSIGVIFFGNLAHTYLIPFSLGSFMAVSLITLFSLIIIGAGFYLSYLASEKVQAGGKMFLVEVEKTMSVIEKLKSEVESAGKALPKPPTPPITPPHLPHV